MGFLERNLPIDQAFLSDKVLQDLPGGNILKSLRDSIGTFEDSLKRIIQQLNKALRQIDTSFDQTQSEWQVRKRKVQIEYEKILRELQKSKVDGEEFIRLRRQVEELRPLKERQAVITKEQELNYQKRRNLLSEWEEVRRLEFQQLEKAAKKVSRELNGRVSVQVAYSKNRDPLISVLTEKIGGRLSEAKQILKDAPELSLVEFVEACRGGRDEIVRKFSIPSSQADRLASADESTYMSIEELDLHPTTQIRLNVASEGQVPMWKTLDELSTGQKATALLLLLLLESDAPLVVDQPEDDLDNRFITEGIVPKMREEKRQRQFLFATHNANIPVLGDAELILGLRAAGEAGGEGYAEIPREHVGSIDNKLVRDLVEEILEGGQEAFEMRRRKYGF